jgi:hypothetical protein
MEVKDLRILEWKPTILVPVGDVQFGSTACSEDLFKRWLDRILNKYHNKQTLFLGMGDYTDSLRPSIRKALESSHLRDDEHIGDSITERVNRHIEGFVDLVAGTEGMWLGMLEGHHFFDFGYGTTSDTMLADALHTTFLGDCTLFNLLFKKDKDVATFIVWAHHGEGGGNTAGAPLNKIESVSKGYTADAFLMAHQHKAVTTKLPMLYLTRDENKEPLLTHYDYSLTCTGGWLQGYQQSSISGNRPGGHYPEQKMLRPISIGATRLELEPLESGEHGVFHEVII